MTDWLCGTVSDQDHHRSPSPLPHSHVPESARDSGGEHKAEPTPLPRPHYLDHLAPTASPSPLSISSSSSEISSDASTIPPPLSLGQPVLPAVVVTHSNDREAIHQHPPRTASDGLAEAGQQHPDAAASHTHAAATAPGAPQLSLLSDSAPAKSAFNSNTNLPVDNAPGTYLHVVKERLLGIYFTVYVYRGCEHLIQGVDRDFVTAGLAGGRVGNKGGIGISIKLAGHRLLFVNSHLAAHTDKLSARLSNINKIKSELRLDCFLPKDDPRHSLPDISDRFDTVFWCGDLNFRLDLSRLHAEWLVEQRKYAEALMWDQLKVVMKDAGRNPFPGFEEAVIDFPPTFKYDVWKSVKATNRDLRRSLKRQGTFTDKAKPVPIPGTSLSHVQESHQEQNDIAESRTSVDSSRYSMAASTVGSLGTDTGDEAQSRPGRSVEASFKEKTKSFLSYVKMDGLLGSRKSQARSRPYAEDVAQSTSTLSLNERLGESEQSTSASLLTAPPSALGLSPSPLPEPARGRSGLLRTFSSRSARESDAVDLDDSVDNREGVYDSSKKQRVPSWVSHYLLRCLL